MGYFGELAYNEQPRQLIGAPVEDIKETTRTLRDRAYAVDESYNTLIDLSENIAINDDISESDRLMKEEEVLRLKNELKDISEKGDFWNYQSDVLKSAQKYSSHQGLKKAQQAFVTRVTNDKEIDAMTTVNEEQKENLKRNAHDKYKGIQYDATTNTAKGEYNDIKYAPVLNEEDVLHTMFKDYQWDSEAKAYYNINDKGNYIDSRTGKAVRKYINREQLRQNMYEYLKNNEAYQNGQATLGIGNHYNTNVSIEESLARLEGLTPEYRVDDKGLVIRYDENGVAIEPEVIGYTTREGALIPADKNGKPATAQATLQDLYNNGFLDDELQNVSPERQAEVLQSIIDKKTNIDNAVRTMSEYYGYQQEDAYAGGSRSAKPGGGNGSNKTPEQITEVIVNTNANTLNSGDLNTPDGMDKAQTTINQVLNKRSTKLINEALNTYQHNGGKFKNVFSENDIRNIFPNADEAQIQEMVTNGVQFSNANGITGYIANAYGDGNLTNGIIAMSKSDDPSTKKMYQILMDNSSDVLLDSFRDDLFKQDMLETRRALASEYAFKQSGININNVHANMLADITNSDGTVKDEYKINVGGKVLSPEQTLKYAMGDAIKSIDTQFAESTVRALNSVFEKAVQEYDVMNHSTTPTDISTFKTLVTDANSDNIENVSSVIDNYEDQLMKHRKYVQDYYKTVEGDGTFSTKATNVYGGIFSTIVDIDGKATKVYARNNEKALRTTKAVNKYFLDKVPYNLKGYVLTKDGWGGVQTSETIEDQIPEGTYKVLGSETNAVNLTKTVAWDGEYHLIMEIADVSDERGQNRYTVAIPIDGNNIDIPALNEEINNETRETQDYLYTMLKYGVTEKTLSKQYKGQDVRIDLSTDPLNPAEADYTFFDDSTFKLHVGNEIYRGQAAFAKLVEISNSTGEKGFNGKLY